MLAKLIQEFAELHSIYQSGGAAWGQCCEASANFIDFARVRGYTDELRTYEFWANESTYSGDRDQPNPDPENYVVTDAEGRTLLNDAGIGMCHWHCIVDAGHILIDFTARQYRQHYAYPHIIPFEEKLFTSIQRAYAAKAGL